jgi:hypothetical protein
MAQLPVNELSPEDVRGELKLLEAEYGMPSRKFYERYKRGEMGDAAPFMRWATLFEWSKTPSHLKKKQPA